MPSYKGYLKKINYQKIISSLGIKYLKVDGNNVSDVYLKINQAIKYIKKKSAPVFIEFLTYRWLEHCGPFYDYDLKRNYRTKTEIDHWKKSCPVKNFRNFLSERIGSKKIENIEKRINKSINSNFKKALSSKTPNKNDLLKNV